MDHFLFAKNPMKKTPPTGLQGYIIDTVKGTWTKVEIFNQQGKPQQHLLTMIAGTGNNKEDRLSAHRASRWYNAILIARKIEEAEIVVTLPQYTGNEPKPETRYEYLDAQLPDAPGRDALHASPLHASVKDGDSKSEQDGKLYKPDMAPVISLAKKLNNDPGPDQ